MNIGFRVAFKEPKVGVVSFWRILNFDFHLRRMTGQFELQIDIIGLLADRATLIYLF
jgi:hypothetical protein